MAAVSKILWHRSYGIYRSYDISINEPEVDR